MKTTLLMLVALIFCSCQKPVKDPDLVAWWPFDDATTTVVPDQSANHLDALNRGALPVEGKQGKALLFDGKAVLQIDHRPPLDDFDKGLTIMAWVKRDTASDWNTIVSREIGEGWSEYAGLAVYKNQALFSIDQNGQRYKNVVDDQLVPPNVWVHLVGTFDNDSIRLYVDGKLAKAGASNRKIQFSDRNPWLIGGNSNDQNQSLVDCFKGTIDEVRIYKRALSLSEINRLTN